MKIETFSQAVNFINHYIPKEPNRKFPGSLGLKRIKYFLELLGSPQNKLKVIHIAGTSGKGSTAYLTSRLVGGLDFKVGLSLSPHLTDIRERFQVNNSFITGEELGFFINRLMPAVKNLENSPFGPPTYFEMVTVLAFLIFAEKKLDYAVMETGMGGLYDGTNVVDRPDKIVVITKIGLDHTRILGQTLDEIALQKAGIINKGNLVISTVQDESVERMIITTAQSNQSELIWIKPAGNFKNIQLSLEKTVFDYRFDQINLKKLGLGLIGDHQAENAALALTAVYELSRRDGFIFNENLIRQGLVTAFFAGRLEVIRYKNKKIILDGAHNPQKMTALIVSLKKVFPREKPDFLLAFKNDKDFASMLKEILPIAGRIFLTSFWIRGQDLLQTSKNPKEIGEILMRLGYFRYEVINDAKQAFNRLISGRGQVKIISGSLYLISTVYSFLYPVI